MQPVKEKQKKELKGADYEKDWNKINRKGQGNPMEEPIRSGKELQDLHTHTHTFKKKVQRKQNCGRGKGGGEGEKNQERGRLKSQDLDRVKLEELAE